MFGWIFSIETHIVYSYQQSLNSGDKVVGRIIKETVKLFGLTLRTKYVLQKSLPNVDSENVCLMAELNSVNKEVNLACLEKLRIYENE